MLRKICKIMQLAIILITLLTLTACKGYIEGMLNPKGIITYEERRLFFDTLALMLIVVIPVIIMSIAFVYHYRVSHRIRDYKPNWSHNHFLEGLWWGIPCVIIVVLAVLTWKKTYELDPYKPISGYPEKPLLVQVIALPWKWLFIYPEQNIASLNYFEMPVDRQVEFEFTADNTAMSSFFIPQLGSQIYVMSGMRTKLFLLANQIGEYEGMNTLFSGDGFAEMRFATHVVTQEEFDKWAAEVKQTSLKLTNDNYKKLLTPTIKDHPVFFANVENKLFDTVVDTYMMSTGINHPREQLIKQEPTPVIPAHAEISMGKHLSKEIV
jgi:cytochrome o ubiquinol oxidase subunit 2